MHIKKNIFNSWSTKEVSPVCDLTELHNLVKKIEDEEEFNKLVLSLSAAGGKDVKDVVKNIMESGATYDVLAKFNFRATNRLEKNKEPRPSKEAFKSLNICKVVCCTFYKLF
nr:uncharacterized protein LOC124816572 [Hydra vulgaris]